MTTPKCDKNGQYINGTTYDKITQSQEEIKAQKTVIKL